MGRRLVLPHRDDEVVEAVEFGFAANPVHEADFECLAIEVALEVEHVGFEQRCAVVDGRASTEARDPTGALQPASRHGDSIDAVRQPRRTIEPHVGGRVAERAAELLPVQHLAQHEIIMPEPLRRLHDVAARQRIPDGGRRHGGEIAERIGRDLVDHLDREAIATAGIGQERGRALRGRAQNGSRSRPPRPRRRGARPGWSVRSPPPRVRRGADRTAARSCRRRRGGASASALAASGVRRKMTGRPAKKLAGCGSKVQTAKGRPILVASALARAMTAL